MKKILTLCSLFLPSVAFASGLSNFADLTDFLIGFINLLMPIVAGLALLSFFWGLVQFIYNAGDSASRADGKNLMIYGLLALFIMVSFWGIITITKRDLGLNSRTGIPYIRRN